MYVTHEIVTNIQMKINIHYIVYAYRNQFPMYVNNEFLIFFHLCKHHFKDVAIIDKFLV